MIIKLKEIKAWAAKNGYDFSFEGDEEDSINGFSSLTNYREGTITWIKKDLPKDNALLAKIKCAVVTNGISCDIYNCFYAPNSKELFFAILDEFFSDSSYTKPIGEGTVIDENVVLADNVIIGKNCSLSGEISIGKGTIIESNVTIMNKVSIGENCIIHAGTVIGKDGFGFAFDKDNIPVKVPHFGGVSIGNRVEIGANCVIDRGTIDDTTIENDVKIDSLSLITHNAYVGSGTLIVGCASLGGSSKVGSKSYIGPHAFIKNQISVGNNSLIGMGVIVSESVEDNSIFPNNCKRPLSVKDYRRFL